MDSVDIRFNSFVYKNAEWAGDSLHKECEAARTEL